MLDPAQKFCLVQAHPLTKVKVMVFEELCLLNAWMDLDFCQRVLFSASPISTVIFRSRSDLVKCYKFCIQVF